MRNRVLKKPFFNQVSAKRIAEIDAAKTLQMDNAVASLDRKAKSEISSLKQEMGKMFTRDQMNSFTSRSKAPLMSQLRLMKEVRIVNISHIVTHVNTFAFEYFPLKISGSTDPA